MFTLMVILKRLSRRKPNNVISNSLARSTARLEGAPIATTTGIPAIAAFV